MYQCMEDVPTTVWEAELNDEIRVEVRVPAADMSVEQARELGEKLLEIAAAGDAEISQEVEQYEQREHELIAADAEEAQLRRLDGFASQNVEARVLLRKRAANDGRAGTAPALPHSPRYMRDYAAARKAAGL